MNNINTSPPVNDSTGTTQITKITIGQTYIVNQKYQIKPKQNGKN